MHMYCFNYSEVGVYKELEEQAEQTTIFIPKRRSAFIHSSPPCSPKAHPRVGGNNQERVCNHPRHGYARAPEKQEKEKKVSDNKMYKEGKGRGRVGVRKYSNLSCDKVCQGSCAPSGKAKDNTHTHTLKMKSRDQSSDGQVGENKRHLMDGGSVEWKRSNAVGFISLTDDDDAQHEDRHFYDGRAERQT